MSSKSERNLFNVGKVPLFLDKIQHGVEKRRGETTKILKLTLRMQPFDAKRATSLDQGLGGDTNVRANVFQMNGNADPKPHVERMDFSLDIPRQNLVIFPAPDAGTRLAFTQAKVDGVYVRTQKDQNSMALVFEASFGPVGREELEEAHRWFRSMQFVTFQESEPLLSDADEDQESGDDDEPSDTIDGRSRFAGPPLPIPTPEHDGEEDIAAAPVREEAVRRPRAVHATKAKHRKRDPEGERTRQAKAGKKHARGSKSKR